MPTHFSRYGVTCGGHQVQVRFTTPLPYFLKLRITCVVFVGCFVNKSAWLSWKIDWKVADSLLLIWDHLWWAPSIDAGTWTSDPMLNVKSVVMLWSWKRLFCHISNTIIISRIDIHDVGSLLAENKYGFGYLQQLTSSQLIMMFVGYFDHQSVLCCYDKKKTETMQTHLSGCGITWHWQQEQLRYLQQLSSSNVTLMFVGYFHLKNAFSYHKNSVFLWVSKPMCRMQLLPFRFLRSYKCFLIIKDEWLFGSWRPDETSA